MSISNESDLASVRELWSLLDNTVFAVSRLREIELSQFDLTIAQASILFTLQANGSMTLQELEKNGLRQHHSVSTLINRMTTLGLVNKVKNSEDKRYRIVLSEEGKALNNKITSSSLEMAFSVLNTKQKHELKQCLIPLLGRAKYLLGMSQTAPFLLHLEDHDNQNPDNATGEDPKSATDYDLWILFDRVGFAVSRLRELELARFGLTTPQAAILYALQNNKGEMTLQEIENKRMRQHHSIFILINRMIKMGIISQVKNSKDKKDKIVITQEGQEIYNKLTTSSLEMTFSSLSLEQQQKLSSYLALIHDRARYLLGVSYMPPFLQYLIEGESKKPKDTYCPPERTQE